MIACFSFQFRTFGSSWETLVGVTFGDEVYATLHMLDVIGKTGARYLIWLFFRFYIFSYIALATFVVVNLMMAIVIGAYESILVSKT